MAKKKKKKKRKKVSQRPCGAALWVHIPESESGKTGWIRVMRRRFRCKKKCRPSKPPREGNGFEAMLRWCAPPPKKRKGKKKSIDCYYDKTGCEMRYGTLYSDCQPECECPLDENAQNGESAPCQ